MAAAGGGDGMNYSSPIWRDFMKFPAYLCIPSARPRAEAQTCIDAWRNRGYGVAIWRDSGAEELDCDLRVTGDYPGYAKAVNALVQEVLKRDTECSWFVTGGDDTLPDQNHTADEIARQCSEYFAKNFYRSEPIHPELEGLSLERTATFGVVQPTGDRFACGSIDRIAGSPWMGREFCQRIYGGKGPLFEGYQHMFPDEELLCVAQILGVYWMRPDLIHFHRHFMRKNDSIDSPAVSKPPPPHLVKWNSAEHWNESKALFEKRKSEGFPGSAPLTTGVFSGVADYEPALS